MSKYCPNWLSRTIHDQYGDTKSNLDNQSIFRATRLTHYPHFSMLFWKMWDVFKVDTDVADYWLQLSYIPGEWWGWCRPWCHCSILAGVPSVWWDHWYSHRAAHRYLTTPAIGWSHNLAIHWHFLLITALLHQPCSNCSLLLKDTNHLLSIFHYFM